MKYELFMAYSMRFFVTGPYFEWFRELMNRDHLTDEQTLGIYKMIALRSEWASRIAITKHFLRLYPEFRTNIELWAADVRSRVKSSVMFNELIEKNIDEALRISNISFLYPGRCLETSYGAKLLK